MTVAALSAVALVVAGCGSAPQSSGSADKSRTGPYKIALSLSYTGNDWQDQAANLVKGAAATEPYKSKVQLRVDIAGSDVTKQIQTINNEIAAGMDAIIVYPISPTALNATIQKACDAGIIVYAYDSLVTAPCAYNVHIDQYEWGVYNATWLAEHLNGKGNIANITGVPGTTVDSDRQKALKDVLKKYPGIKIAGSASGAWAQAQGKQAYTTIEASNPNIDGIYAQAGCWAITEYILSKGKDPIPCAGEMENGAHVYMLSKENGGVNLQGSSAGSPVYSGELAFINSVRILDGKKVGKNTILPLPKFNTEELQAKGKDAIGLDPTKGALVFPPDKVSGGFFGDFWNPLVEQGIEAALTGKSDKISDAKPCAEVEGCKETDKLTLDDNHAGGN